MKLYATTTSERATKGQGGNKYIDIDILDGDATTQRKVAKINIYIENNQTYLKYNDCVGNDIFENITKGKRQKGDNKCKYCGKIGLDYTNIKNPFCHNCKQQQN